jgi:hypothetical protein
MSFSLYVSVPSGTFLIRTFLHNDVLRNHRNGYRKEEINKLSSFYRKWHMHCKKTSNARKSFFSAPL